MSIENEPIGVSSDYRVDIGVFQGPLDLLLFLIRKEEVDIYNIPIAKITRQYLKYVNLITAIDLEVAGEYILMAATLIRIKTKMLLPRTEGEEDTFDPREELIMALVEYKKFKEASEILRDRALIEEQTYVPPSPVGKIESKVDLMPATTLFDLVSAFKQVLSGARSETFHQVGFEEVSIEDRVGHLLVFFKDKEMATFYDLFADAPKKIVAVVTFIALLELVRSHRLTVMQSVPFAEVRVYRGERYFDRLDEGEAVIAGIQDEVVETVKEME